MKKNNNNWKTIEEEFRKKFVKLQDVTKFNDERCSYDYLPSKRDYKILAFFKPYFQEQMHKEAVKSLEEEPRMITCHICKRTYTRDLTVTNFTELTMFCLVCGKNYE